MLYMEVASPMCSLEMGDRVRIVSGMKIRGIPMPRVTLGQTKLQKSVLRLNKDIEYVVPAQIRSPAVNTFFGFTLVTNIPEMGMTRMAANPPGPRTSPA